MECSNRRNTLTLGVSQFDSADDSYEDVLIRVDRALYQGKERGRNQVVVIVSVRLAAGAR